MDIPFDNSYARLVGDFHQPATPARVPAPGLIRLNEALAESLHLSPSWLASPAGLDMLSGNAVVAGSEPISQAYAGHQFGGFSPQLGDGRAILLGEIVDRGGVRRDIQLKGSGRTYFSRGGDGKAALGPALREYLMSEAMHALGVPATRALAVVSTGEMVRRETLLPGAVFTRVASSHLRVGTFQFFAAREDVPSLRTLLDYAIARHFPSAAEEGNPALSFFRQVISAQASLIARWMSIGFIHGVMNTDNTAISGETIDFGPCAFMDEFHPQCVFSAIDAGGRYAWENQPLIAQWNLARLAEAILPLLHEEPESAVAMAEDALGAFSSEYSAHCDAAFRAKLALPADAPSALVNDTLDLLAAQHVDFTLFFTRLTDAASTGDAAPLVELFSDAGEFYAWHTRWQEHARPAGLLPAMLAANPVLIPRNHWIERAIQAANGGDFSVFHRLAEAWQHPFSRAATADLQAAPLPQEKVHQTFCGT